MTSETAIGATVDPPRPPRRPAVRDCRVCGVPHDEEIHTAVVNVHLWFRGTVLRYLDDSPPASA